MREVYTIQIPEEYAFVPLEARNYITAAPTGNGWEFVGCIERHEIAEDFCQDLGLAGEAGEHEFTHENLGNLDEAVHTDGYLQTRKVMCHRALFRRKILPNVAE